MIPKDILEDLQTALLAEQAALEEELADHGRPEGDDWEGSSESDGEESDPGDVADNITELATNVPMIGELKRRKKEIKVALQKIEDGVYGRCDVCDEEIPLERLEANPAAATCVRHADE